MTILKRIELAITQATNQTAIICQSNYASGGCINQSQIVTLEDGREYFVKTNPNTNQLPGFFQSEFESLKIFFEVNIINVPRPVVVEDEFIILEVFHQGTPNHDWQETIGHKLAILQQQTQKNQFGFTGNNYLGTSQQLNEWQNNWLDFFREQRLGYQLNLFKQRCSANDELLKIGDQLLDKLDEIIGNIDEPSVLLHGDLWSGNAAANENGEPVIFDPAGYYGHREAEFGMMRLFGGFGSRCEAAYQEVWPFAEDSERRISLYRLYHELNHLNLFGAAYYSTCLSTMRNLI